MAYYVYENWTRDRGRIHRAECSHCNNGIGMHASDSGQNGKWHGPYSDIKSANEAAQRLRRADMKPCGVCKP
jgi:hypothetical protein